MQRRLDSGLDLVAVDRTPDAVFEVRIVVDRDDENTDGELSRIGQRGPGKGGPIVRAGVGRGMLCRPTRCAPASPGAPVPLAATTPDRR